MAAPAAAASGQMDDVMHVLSESYAKLMLWFKHDDEPSFLDYLNEYHFFYEHITTSADAEKSRIALLRARTSRATRRRMRLSATAT